MSRPAVSPHAAEVGGIRRLLGRFHFTGIFWYRSHLWGASVVPNRLRRPLLNLFTVVFQLFLHRIRGAIGANLEAVLGPCGFLERQRRVFRTLHAFAWCLTERYENLADVRRPEWTLEGEEHWRSLDLSGRGCVMVTAHVGNWEVGSMLPARAEGRRVHVAREQEMDPRAQAFIESRLKASSRRGYITHFATDDPSLGIALLDALRAGDLVALQGDRPRGGGRTVQVEFLGRPMDFPVGPSTLARLAEAEILPAFVLREGRLRYRMVLRPPFRVARTADRDADVYEATQRIADEVTWAVREAPHQWFCFSRLWP
jgi:lauroyl/myristoyl acyltransferase